MVDYFLNQEKNQIVLSFKKIERIIKSTFSYSAYQYQAWQGNIRSGTSIQFTNWLEAEFRVGIIL